MTYKHGVYTSEVSTSVQNAASVDCALPYVIGYGANDSAKIALCRSWSEFAAEFCDADDEDEILATVDVSDGVCKEHKYSLTSFAYYWFNIMCRGDCIFQSLPVQASSISGTDIVTAIGSLDTAYERFQRVPTILVVPYYSAISTVRAAMASKMESFGGGRFKGVALVDIPNRNHVNVTGVTPVTAVNSVSNATTSPNCVSCWPFIRVGGVSYDISTSICAVMNRTGGQNMDLPFVSPSNKSTVADGTYVWNGDASTKCDTIFMNRETVNDSLNAKGVVSLLNTASGWVIWGNRTTAYPGSSDIKDNMIPIRRMFNHISNDFQTYAQTRIDLPLNKRQLEGVINSYNQRLMGFKGIGAVNSASVALDSTLNTTASMLDGAVYLRILISPPPPMRDIEAVIEYDVAGFEASLA